MNINELYRHFIKAGKVSTDTRQIDPGVLFFALKGANFNGNAFASQALEKGAAYVVIDEAEYKKDERYLLVHDVLETLQQLALHHRRQFNIPFIAITGSNGKTTTKELVNVVLSKKYKTYATQGNLNNHIGIPLTLLAIQPGTEIAIIEMGANHQKEIASYCQYTEPTHGLITNIGKAHLEGFGGVEGIKKGKGELYDYLLSHQGQIFLNSTDETLKSMSKFNQPIVYPGPKDFYSCTLIESTPFVKLRSSSGREITTHLTGTYNFDNITAALCVGKFFGVEESQALEAVASYAPQNNRSQILQKGSNQLMLDAYNANPSSMKAALENFSSLAHPSKVAILGDMFELGQESEREHRALGQLLNQFNIAKIYLCGKNMAWAAQECSKAIYLENKEALAQLLKKETLENSFILLKGSRGMSLETLKDLF